MTKNVDLDLLVYKLYCPWKIEPTVGRVCVQGALILSLQIPESGEELSAALKTWQRRAGAIDLFDGTLIPGVAP